MKKGGRASRDKDSSAVLPSTHIHSDPLSSVCLSLTDTLTHTRCSHHMAVNAQMISSIHTQSSYSHRCTHPSTSSSKHNTNNTFTQHTASALTHLGRGKIASCFLSVSRRVGCGGGGCRGGGGDARGGGGTVYILTLSRDRRRGTGRERERKEEEKERRTQRGHC